MMAWLRGNKYAAALLTLVRLYVGWEWLHAGWEKITGEKAFSAAGFLNGAVTKPIVDHATNAAVYPNYVYFLKHFALPNIGFFNFLVPWGEFLVGLGLMLGCLTTAAMFFGLMMNFAYMLAGTLSTNPWLALLGFFVIAAGANAGKFGLDYYVLPYVRNYLKFGHEASTAKHRAAAR